MEIEGISIDDYKLMCCQRYNSSPPMRDVQMSWPIMSLKQKVMIVAFWASLIGLGLLFVFGGPLEYLIG